MDIQRNPSIPDAVGLNNVVLYSEVSLTEGLCLFLSQIIIFLQYIYAFVIQGTIYEFFLIMFRTSYFF